MRELVRVYKALSDESRLRILAALADVTGFRSRQASRPFQPTLSHHLKILTTPGLSRRARGPSTYCTLNAEAFERYGICIDKLLTRCRQTAWKTTTE